MVKNVLDKRKTQLNFLILGVIFFITKDPFYWVADVGFALGVKRESYSIILPQQWRL